MSTQRLFNASPCECNKNASLTQSDPHTIATANDDTRELLVKATQQATVQYREAKTALQEADEVFQETKAELQATRAEAQSYVLELARAKNTIRLLQQQNDDLIQQVIDVEGRYKGIEQHCVQLGQENTALVQRLEHLQAAKQALIQEISRLHQLGESADLKDWDQSNGAK